METGHPSTLVVETGLTVFPGDGELNDEVDYVCDDISCTFESLIASSSHSSSLL